MPYLSPKQGRNLGTKREKSHFPVADWTEFYRDAKEEVPINAPEALGKEVQIYCFCDADHAGDRLMDVHKQGSSYSLIVHRYNGTLRNKILWRVQPLDLSL